MFKFIARWFRKPKPEVQELSIADNVVMYSTAILMDGSTVIMYRKN